MSFHARRPVTAEDVKYIETPAISASHVSRRSNTVQHSKEHEVEDHHAGRLPSTCYAPPDDGRRNGAYTTIQSRDDIRRNATKPLSNPCGKSKTGEGLSTRHVRFEPVSINPPGRSSSPLARRGPRYTSAHPSMPGYQRSPSLTRTVPERLKIKGSSRDKGTVTPAKRIEELTRENGMLRQELLHYKETHNILINYLHVSDRLQKGLKGSLDDTVRGLSVAEQPLRVYWGLDSGGRDETETMF